MARTISLTTVYRRVYAALERPITLQTPQRAVEVAATNEELILAMREFAWAYPIALASCESQISRYVSMLLDATITKSTSASTADASTPRGMRSAMTL